MTGLGRIRNHLTAHHAWFSSLGMPGSASGPRDDVAIGDSVESGAPPLADPDWFWGNRSLRSARTGLLHTRSGASLHFHAGSVRFVNRSVGFLAKHSKMEAMISRRTVLGGLASAVAGRAQRRKPNFLFLLADDHAGYVLGADGNR